MRKDDTTSIDEIKEQVETRTGSGDDSGGNEPPEHEPGKDLPPKFMDQCFGDNLMGDAKLFATVCKGRFLYNKNSGPAGSAKARWYKWNEHYWEEDNEPSLLKVLAPNLCWTGYRQLMKTWLLTVKSSTNRLTI
jgi:hypothetical protein